MKHAYVYYRIDPAQEATAAAKIDALLGAMAEHCARPPRRLSRCDDPDVWMEVYESIADYTAYLSVLEKAVLSLECAAFTQGERHLECFTQGNHGRPGSAVPRTG